VRRHTVVVHAVLLVAALIVVVPFVWIAAAAFKTPIALLSGAFWFEPIWNNFHELLFTSTSEYLDNYLNSFVVGAASTLLDLVVATLAAYSIVRMGWPRWAVSAVLMWSIVFHMIPPITMLGGWFTMFRSIGLVNTWTGLTLAHATLNLPLALWIMSAFVREVPVELEEAARLDGCGTARLLWRVIVPLVRPGLAAAAILVFIFSWNEFPVALTLTQKATATVPVAIAKFAQEFEIQYTQMAAGAVLSVLPALVLLIVGQRQIVRGLTAGALK
jgi:multiple sugar transport system permease protein